MGAAFGAGVVPFFALRGVHPSAPTGVTRVRNDPVFLLRSLSGTRRFHVPPHCRPVPWTAFRISSTRASVPCPGNSTPTTSTRQGPRRRRSLIYASATRRICRCFLSCTASAGVPKRAERLVFTSTKTRTSPSSAMRSISPSAQLKFSSTMRNPRSSRNRRGPAPPPIPTPPRTCPPAPPPRPRPPADLAPLPPRRHQGKRDLPDPREGPPMDRAQPVLCDRAKMRLRAVSLVPIEAVDWIRLVILSHHPVSGHLGHDGGGTDRRTLEIASGHGKDGRFNLGNGQPVDDDPLGGYPEFPPQPPPPPPPRPAPPPPPPLTSPGEPAKSPPADRPLDSPHLSPPQPFPA